MNMIRLPIPNEYVYIDTDKIVSMDFDAYDGKLTLCLLDDITRIIYTGAKSVLDKILEATKCSDGIPSIARKTKPKEPEHKIINTVYNEVSEICDLIT